MTDTLQKFMFDDATVRGELVELNATWKQVLTHHNYPLPVQNLLGELTCAAALLCANLKFDGSMIMQIHGEGAIKLLVVECDNQLQVRAMAKLAENAHIADNASLSELVNANGHGRFVITLDPNNKVPGQQAYQGIVPLEGDSIAAVIENYMKQSEQLDTKLWLASDSEVSRGMLLQRLPCHGGSATHATHDEELSQAESAEQAWTRACLLGNTLKRDELLSASTATLLHRLFWEETLRIFEPQDITFSCSCSREKVGNMLVMLGKEEVTEAVNSLGKLDINCDFCGKPYSFDAVDCTQLFLSPEIKINPEVDRTH
ncbi:Hsp33 family molecular chaperone HslO [Solimicrobium silvestre]|uniref:Disulfide bond chaperones of the HSP33 family n=1 Tax=Solimicrobium silvestre TaxID=2099400 RepID=A0A2S9GUT5_9BURK|nr:Hsp33 family molecular chaperone HslO [Solimicrobium silvestre]PRC91471.1 Disulfide bond chaperones of the HSP33 family [Solimicrobium silvestre]